MIQMKISPAENWDMRQQGLIFCPFFPLWDIQAKMSYHIADKQMIYFSVYKQFERRNSDCVRPALHKPASDVRVMTMSAFPGFLSAAEIWQTPQTNFMSLKSSASQAWLIDLCVQKKRNVYRFDIFEDQNRLSFFFLIQHTPQFSLQRGLIAFAVCLKQLKCLLSRSGNRSYV